MDILEWHEAARELGLNSTAAGNIKFIPDFYMPQLNRSRDLWICLPEGYDEHPRKRYPVLYMHDGQNLFDASTSYAGEWSVDKTLYAMGRPQVIVVGIANGDELRMSEYTPSQEGHQYALFLTETLKPFIDKAFRTMPGREYTGTAGSSMGGLIALYLGVAFDSVFSRIGSFSPALVFDEALTEGWDSPFPSRIYLDVGVKEGLPYMEDYEYATRIWSLYFDLLHRDFPADRLWFNLDPYSDHSEAAWAARFGPAVRWMFKRGGL